MKTEFIPTELANEMIKLGFDDFTIFFGDSYKEYLLWQQAFRWFREKYGLMGVVDCFFYNFSYTYNINDIENEKIITRSSPDDDFNSYEEAELACLKKLIEIAKINKP